MNRRKDQSGFVLIVVLIIVAILTTLVVDMFYFTQVDREIAANTRDDVRSRYIAKSGINLVAGTMKERSLEELTEISTAMGAEGGDSEGLWMIRVPFFPVGDDGGVSIEVVDERGKINLNALVSTRTNRVDQQVLVQLTELFRLLEIDTAKSERFISSLINWLDSDLKGTSNDQDARGATSGYYRSLEFPYNIKDGPLDSLDEIKMIDGMDIEFFEAVKGYLTVYSKDKRVNFSTAPKVVMMAVLKSAMVSAIEGQGENEASDLQDDVAEDIAESVIEERGQGSIVKRSKVNQIARNIDATLGIGAGLGGVVMATGKSGVFRVTATGSLGFENPTVKIIDAVIRKRQRGTGRSIRVVTWKEK